MRRGFKPLLIGDFAMDEDMKVEKAVWGVLNDHKEFGLGVEVLSFALKRLCANEKEILDALDYATAQWIK